MPAVGDPVELGEQRLRYRTRNVFGHRVGELPPTFMASVPCLQARTGEPFGPCSVLSAECTEALAEPANAVAPAVRDREERARSAARGELTEDTASDLEVPFDHEVHHVVRELRVITRPRRHVQDWAAATIGRDRVAPFSGPGEGDLHETNDAKRGWQGEPESPLSW
jgi:hypothetical protein